MFYWPKAIFLVASSIAPRNGFAGDFWCNRSEGRSPAEADDGEKPIWTRTGVLSQNKGITTHLTEEWLIQQTPEVQVMIRHLLAEIAELKEQVRKRTPQNSSLPPSSRYRSRSCGCVRARTWQFRG